MQDKKWERVQALWSPSDASSQENTQDRNGNTKMEMNAKKRVAKILLVMGLSFAGAGARAQETRKTLNSPTPAYPETARQFRLSGVVKVQVLIAPDGQIKDVKVIGGHPLLVSAVQDTLKNWKYAPASNETTATLVFNFRP